MDGVIVCPAYVEPGRLTVDSVHWARTNDGMIPVSHSEFAKDASFGYRSSDLRDWVEERPAGGFHGTEVARITLTDIRVGGPDRVFEILSGVRRRPTGCGGYCRRCGPAGCGGRLCFARRRLGKNFIYRIGPSFVRARTGQRATPPIDAQRLREILASQPADPDDTSPGHQARPDRDRRPTSHCTTRQLDRLRTKGKIIELELDVPTLLDDDSATSTSRRLPERPREC